MRDILIQQLIIAEDSINILIKDKGDSGLITILSDEQAPYLDNMIELKKVLEDIACTLEDRDRGNILTYALPLLNSDREVGAWVSDDFTIEKHEQL